jgi:hypothetical protein
MLAPHDRTEADADRPWLALVPVVWPELFGEPLLASAALDRLTPGLSPRH